MKPQFESQDIDRENIDSNLKVDISLQVRVFKNFVGPMNPTNPIQSKPKLVGSYFNWVRLDWAAKHIFFPLLGRVAGYHNDNPKQLNQAKHKVSNTFLCYTIICSLPLSPMLISINKENI